MTDPEPLPGFTALQLARPASRPCARGEIATSSVPAARVSSSAPFEPMFAVADHDRDTWRLFDGENLLTLTREELLLCHVHVPLLVIEGCHLVAQGDMSISAPFTAYDLEALAVNARAHGVEIRAVPNRRFPRAVSEAGYKWEDRPKERDTETWHRWLSAKPARLASCRRWPAARDSVRVDELRVEIMRDVNMVRQWRQFPEAPQSEAFADRVLRALIVIFEDLERGRHLRAVTARLGCPWNPRAVRPWDTRGSVHIHNAYCVARDARSGQSRTLTARRVRRICGLYANGYPNQVRADLRYHGRTLGPPTQVDRAFVSLAMLFNESCG